jgi:hypothetical protein
MLKTCGEAVVYGDCSGGDYAFLDPHPKNKQKRTYSNDHFKNRKEMRSVIYNSSIARKKG